MIASRRGFLAGFGALMVAPAIVRVDSLMKVKFMDPYNTRCLVDYDIGTDQLILRVDRALHELTVPRRGVVPVSMVQAKKLLPQWAFDMQPPAGVQNYVCRTVTTAELMTIGAVPLDWGFTDQTTGLITITERRVA